MFFIERLFLLCPLFGGQVHYQRFNCIHDSNSTAYYRSLACYYNYVLTDNNNYNNNYI